MENDKRIALTVALIAIIAIAAIGAGYAYTAMTQNSGNSAGAEYIVITPTDDTATPKYSGSIAKSIAYDTIKTEGYVTYSIANDISGKVADMSTVGGPSERERAYC